MDSFLKHAATVRPTQRQLDWYDMEMYAFIHFGPNTFTDREWGDGSESEDVFYPEKLDCDQWVAAIKEAGMKGMVLTAKHHDGFCLWPSKYTEHSVKNSPCKRDIVREAAQACRRGGIKFGFYLSPWDRNSAYYGTEAYNDYFCNQLTELLTEYGDIFYVWFDNACGEGPNGKRQVYDFKRYIELIRKYQPNAVIFNDFGPDVRWCGNEAGVTRHAEWAVIPSELCYHSTVQTGPGPLVQAGDLSYLYNTDKELGSLSQILYSKGLTFTPAEINMSIRPGWFWHKEENPHSLERLFTTYINSVGGNACFHLNLPPTTDGLIDERDVARLKEFGTLIRQEFGENKVKAIEKCGVHSMQPIYKIKLNCPVSEVKYVVLREAIEEGQRVESFRIMVDSYNGGQYPVYQGTCIGNRKICQLQDPFSDQNPLIQFAEEPQAELIVHVTGARADVDLKTIEVF